MKLQHTWSPSNHSDGKVPWLQIGDRTRTKKPYPERYGAIGDSSAVEETFQPHLTSTPPLAYAPALPVVTGWLVTIGSSGSVALLRPRARSQPCCGHPHGRHEPGHHSVMHTLRAM